MSDDRMLDEAIAAAREGDRTRARDLLTRLLRTDQSNPEYWLWMSSIVDSPKEKIYCLVLLVGAKCVQLRRILIKC